MPSPNRPLAALLLIGAMANLAACGTPERPYPAARARPVSDVPVKIGPPYQAGGHTWVPADDPRYDAIGLGSWYGGAHRGRPTANGERFDPDGISAAHATLPLPSYVEVTALASGRTILVRINDRGPFAGGRIIDLSQGAARLLGIERDGVARVRVRRVSPSEADRAALRAGRAAAARQTLSREALARLNVRALPTDGAAPFPPPPGPRTLGTVPPRRAVSPHIAAGLFYVQIAALDDADRADALASELGAIGPAAAVAIGPLWRVRIGPYASEATAREALARAERAGYHEAQVVRESAP